MPKSPKKISISVRLHEVAAMPRISMDRFLTILTIANKEMRTFVLNVSHLYSLKMYSRHIISDLNIFCQTFRIQLLRAADQCTAMLSFSVIHPLSASCSQSVSQSVRSFVANHIHSPIVALQNQKLADHDLNELDAR